MINITKFAQKYLINLLNRQENDYKIRIFIINPGTIHAECGIAYCSINEINNSDIEIKFGKLSVYIDKFSSLYLKETEIDLISDNLNYQLVIKSPYAKLLNNEEKNVTLFDKINYIINSKINPQLNIHGGLIILKKINKNMIAILEFKGSCNGCKMLTFTLKEKIEKILLGNFPELKGIKDSTKHKHGLHSYF